MEDVKIEAGQIQHPECFPLPNELVCIQVPKVFDQVAIRDCVSRTVTLLPGSGIVNPVFTFEQIDNFDILEMKVISKTDSVAKPGFKKLKLFVKVGYTIHYSDGVNELTQNDEAGFNLTINEIYCPGCFAQIGVIFYPDECGKTGDVDKTIIKVEAICEAFNDMINPTTGVLTFDIGCFFVVKCECIVQLLIPAFGYCPVPPEQPNCITQNCTTFCDKTKTPFPTSFFPDQKWNPLD